MRHFHKAHGAALVNARPAPAPAPPPKQPHPIAQLYGDAVAPRLKWTCPRCARRNDNALAVPIGASEVLYCKGCRRAHRIQFTHTPTTST